MRERWLTAACPSLHRVARCGFRQVTIDRCQPMGYHASINNDGEPIPSQAHAAFRDCQRLIRDVNQMRSLLAAVDSGSEGDVDALLRHRKIGKIPPGSVGGDAFRPSVGIVNVQNVRGKMCSRLVFALWHRLRLQRRVQDTPETSEVQVPGDPTIGPTLAREPMKRVMAFCSECEARMTLYM